MSILFVFGCYLLTILRKKIKKIKLNLLCVCKIGPRFIAAATSTVSTYETFLVCTKLI